MNELNLIIYSIHKIEHIMTKVKSSTESVFEESTKAPPWWIFECWRQKAFQTECYYVYIILSKYKIILSTNMLHVLKWLMFCHYVLIVHGSDRFFSTSLHIMPLGDSLTICVGDNTIVGNQTGGYRRPLF